MLFRFLFLFLMVSLSFLSAQEIKVRVVHKKIDCLENKDQSYALYLPSSYKKEGKKFPVIFGFSPVARGTDPVQFCQAAAEKFGFVVLGSNNSKNGPSVDIENAFTAMTTDAFKRFHIDPEQVYFVGFSGGSRVSLRKSLEKQFSVKGVIACGAFVSPDWKSDNKDLILFGIAGVDDFNYTEYIRGYEVLKDKDIKYWFRSFDGGHNWPPVTFAHDALEAKSRAGENVSALEEEMISKYIKQAEDFSSKKKYTQAFYLSKSLQSHFKRKPRVEELDKKLAASQEYSQAVTQENAFYEEAKLLKGLADNAKYWSTLDGLLKKTREAGVYQKQSQALLGSLYGSLRQSIPSFEKDTTIPISQKGFYCAVAYKINPADHAVGLLAMAIYATAKNKDKTLELMEALFANGFADKERIAKEPVFDFVRTEERYLKLMK